MSSPPPYPPRRPWHPGSARDDLVTGISMVLAGTAAVAVSGGYLSDRHYNTLHPIEVRIQAEDLVGEARGIVEHMAEPVAYASRRGEIVQFGLVVDDDGRVVMDDGTAQVSYVVVPRPDAEQETIHRWSVDPDSRQAPRAGLRTEDGAASAEVSGEVIGGFAVSGGDHRPLIAGVSEPMPLPLNWGARASIESPRGQRLHSELLWVNNDGRVQPFDLNRLLVTSRACPAPVPALMSRAGSCASPLPAGRSTMAAPALSASGVPRA